MHFVFTSDTPKRSAFGRVRLSRESGNWEQPMHSSSHWWSPRVPGHLDIDLPDHAIHRMWIGLGDPGQRPHAVGPVIQHNTELANPRLQVSLYPDVLLVQLMDYLIPEQLGEIPEA